MSKPIRARAGRLPKQCDFRLIERGAVGLIHAEDFAKVVVDGAIVIDHQNPLKGSTVDVIHS